MRLVIISLDAVFSRDAAFLLSLPALGALADQGVFCDRVKTVYPTLTYPIHASLITGCYPERHGISHNQPYAGALPEDRRPWFWEAEDIRCETLFTQAARAGREVASILWPTTGHSHHIRYNLPEVKALPGENQALKALRFGSAWWLIKTELRYGSIRRGIAQPYLDDFAAQAALSLIVRQARIPDVLALHLTDCDSARHHHGTFSPEAQDSLRRLDERVGRIVEALKARRALDDTVIAVVSDHGQADITGCVALNAWFEEQNVPARAQTLGLGAFVRVHRGDYPVVLKALQDNMPELRLQHVYTREELRAMHAPEDVLLAVEPEEGFAIAEEDCEPGHKATHGFGPDHEGADCLMWLSGPMFPKGARIESCRLVDIAPTLANAVHLHLPEAQGQVLEQLFI
ncbi:MAG: alkaline phosphatase family protein [Eubacteriales bacterium]|nr:alkaline phosphatase family protein [Eubacteriales bacterium]